MNFDVRSGQFFRKGQVIASIDDRDFKVRKEKAEAVYQQAEAEYMRIAALYEKENISASTYEKAKADCAIARTKRQPMNGRTPVYMPLLTDISRR